jgi:hypothetical protein
MNIFSYQKPVMISIVMILILLHEMKTLITGMLHWYVATPPLALHLAKT